MIDSKEQSVPGDLQVLSDDQAKVKIESVSPATVYPTGHHYTYDFEISGDNLGKAAVDNMLEVDKRGPQTVGSSADCKTIETSQASGHMCLSYDAGMSGRKLRVTAFNSGNYEGPVNIRLRVGDNVSDYQTVTLSKLPEWAVRVLAIVVSLAIRLDRLCNGVEGNQKGQGRGLRVRAGLVFSR